jgi:hypothetical protein
VTIIPLDEKTGLMVSYGFNDAAATRGDDRRTGRHRLDRCAAERFVPDGREHEHIRVVYSDRSVPAATENREK